MHRPVIHHLHRHPARSLPGILLVFLLLVTGTALADLVREPTSDGDDDGGARSAFGQLAAGWSAGDESEVAALVHPDGLSITSSQGSGRTIHYSPSQAYYYFKNLFQTNETLAFALDKVQGGEDTGRSHGMATWERRRPGQEKGQILKLMFVMARHEGAWMLTEIHSIR